MTRRFILDGYNIINIWSDLKVLKDESLSLARDELIKIMSEYQAYSGNKVTIVFDGARIEGVKVREEKVLGVQVIFSEPSSTADTVIERLAYKDETPSSLTVVTIDSSLRNFVLGVGTSWHSPQNLEKEVRSVLEQMRQERLKD